MFKIFIIFLIIITFFYFYNNYKEVHIFNSDNTNIDTQSKTSNVDLSKSDHVVEIKGEVKDIIKSTNNPKMLEISNYLKTNYPNTNMGDSYIVVSVPKQELYFINNNNITTYPISTAKLGVGNIMNSNQTPLGLHNIYKKIGSGSDIGTIIKGGVVTNKISPIIIDPISINTDLLITRVIQLTGNEVGVNKGGKVDSLARGIMIHGTPEEGLIGTPASHGCIRMINTDIIKLYDEVSVKTKVIIEDKF